jgi:hypothetical protein
MTSGSGRSHLLEGGRWWDLFTGAHGTSMGLPWDLT